MSTTSLSLFNIESEILNLMLAREALVENDDDLSDAEQKEAITNLDIQIREKLSSDLRANKIDGVAFWFRECWARAEAAGEELTRIQDRKRLWEHRAERFEKYVRDVMLITGQTRLEGNANTIKLAKNPPSVEIAQIDLVPAEYVKNSKTLDCKTWAQIYEALPPDLRIKFVAGVLGKPEPIKTAIKEALKRGDGVPGCRMVTDKMRVDVE